MNLATIYTTIRNALSDLVLACALMVAHEIA